MYQKKRKTEKKIYTVSSGTTKKLRPPRHLVQLSILKGWLGMLDIDTQLNSLKAK